MKSYCSPCRRPTNQNVLKEVKINYNENGWWEDTIYQIIQCNGCDEISFRKLYNNAQIQQNNGIDERFIQELYPNRGPGIISAKKFTDIPFKVKTIYIETVEAFNNEQLILCCGGLRSLIESICIDKSITGIIKKNVKGNNYLQKNLEGKIEGLAESGYLTKDNVIILHELRFLGNDALHELKKPNMLELKLAMEIIELTIDNIYELQHKALKLQQRK